jgi:hypothetical protein
MLHAIDLTVFNLVLMELRLTIAIFVLHFDVELENGQLGPYYKDAFVARRGSLHVKVKPVQKNNPRSQSWESY